MITVDGFLAYLSLSLAANVITTLLIGWKLWTYRQFLSTDLGLKPRSSPALRILVTIVESGLIFAFLQLGFLILQTPTVVDSATKRSQINAENVLNVTFIMLSAFYPSIVALIVNARNSYISSIDFGSDNSAPSSHQDIALTSISFAPPTPNLKRGRKYQLSTMGSIQESSEPLEGSGTLEVLDKDSDVFENKGIGTTCSAP
ncbi:hypothetical protein BDN70DRAFT_373014 [Pholiota conissans]|uniref:Uncharacterized protein n=1 Tax=Pholiota conissans TaxID=109636 RepID=A0A9P6D3X6_9AGAR|nr:hypothetical protein BDN70DRAFT_373014 [Pholiota conissans]